MKANSKVFVSFLGDPGSSWWIGEKGDGDFTLHVKLPVASDAPFEYWIVGVDDRRPASPTEAGTGTAEVTGSVSGSTETVTDSASGSTETPADSGTSTPAGA